MTKVHKASNQSGFLVRRKLRLKGLSEEQWADFMSKLDHHPCVDYVERKSTEVISVTFDASHWSTDDFLAMLREFGGQLADGWWQKRKLAWYRATDDNVRANSILDPFCCSKIPPSKK